MDLTIDFFRQLGAAWIGSFWLPLAGWTILVLFSLGTLRLWRTAPAILLYSLRVALLLALPAGLIFSYFVDVPVFTTWLDRATELQPVAGTGGPSVPISPAPAVLTPVHALRGIVAPFVGFITMLAAFTSFLALIRTIRDFVALTRWHRSIDGIDTPSEITELVTREAEGNGISRPVQVVVTDTEVPPMTFGTWRPVLVLPSSLLDQPQSVLMVVRHELVHIRRFDDLFHRIEQLITNLFVFHPIVSRLKRSIGFFREVSCDASVLAQPGLDRRSYADLLYRLSVSGVAHPLPQLQLSTIKPELTRRIIAMKLQTHRTIPERTAFLLGLFLLGTVTMLVACTETMDPQADLQSSGEEVFIVVEEMPQIVGGMKALYDNIQYPVIARRAGVHGTVIVQLVVDKKGQVQNAALTRTIGAGCDEEALRAVRKLTFKPGKQRGKPVDVRMTIPIEFKLDGSAVNLDAVPQIVENHMTVRDIIVENNIVSGRIFDRETGEVLSGANIVVEGTMVGSVTGPDGRFRIELDKTLISKLLVISYVGYQVTMVQLPPPPPPVSRLLPVSYPALPSDMLLFQPEEPC